MNSPISSNEARRLDALWRYQILDSAAEEMFDDIIHVASVICDTPIALMSLIDKDRQWFKSRVGLDVSETPRAHAFCAHTILGENVLVVEDATEDERFAGNPLVTGEPNIRFYAGAPLIDRSGHSLGSLCVIDRKPKKLSAVQSSTLTALSRTIIHLLELRRLSTDMASALDELKMLRGLLPICSHCKGIKNDKGYWQKVEDYIRSHSDAEFSHSICPECVREHHPELYKKLIAKGSL